jgi:small basic protein (TIGR04137 family)
MSLDRSLKTSAALARHRNVLSRAERVSKLAGVGKFDLTAGNPMGLPKVGNRKVAAGGKAAAKKAEGAEAVPGAPGAAAPAAGAAGAAAPAAGKAPAGGKAPAAGAKAAAPAAKAGGPAKGKK